MRINPKHSDEVLLQLQKEAAFGNEWVVHRPGISVRLNNLDFFKTMDDVISSCRERYKYHILELAPTASVIKILETLKELENLHRLKPVYVEIRAEDIDSKFMKLHQEHVIKNDNKQNITKNIQQRNSLLPKKAYNGLLEKKRVSANKSLGIR